MGCARAEGGIGSWIFALSEKTRRRAARRGAQGVFVRLTRGEGWETKRKRE